MKRKKESSENNRLRIGANIRKWRTMKEVKQKELAAALHLSEAAISNIENDITDVTLSQLESISLALDISVEHLFTNPQESLPYGSSVAIVATEKEQMVMDKEMMYAIIGSMEKKDEQLQHVMQNMLHTIKTLMRIEDAFETLPKA